MELSTMRTIDEIVAKIEAVKPGDRLGLEYGNYIGYLPFKQASPYLVSGASEFDWCALARDRDSILAEMLEYMSFAWRKANGCRGISSSESVGHYVAWLWMIDKEIPGLEDRYDYYGKTCLVEICDKFGWDWHQWDDGLWRRSESDPGISAEEALDVSS